MKKTKHKAWILKKQKMLFSMTVPKNLLIGAIQRFQANLIAPFLTPINWKDSGKTKDKRTYIVCEDDRDVHLSTQLNILKNYPCPVIPFKSGRFPFLSKPKELAEILNSREMLQRD